jgi:hypothetical protein
VSNRESLLEYARREGWREGLRVGRLTVLQPFVFPVYQFVRKNYFTEDGLRFAKIEAAILAHQLFEDPPTANQVLDEIFDLCNRQKPLPNMGKRP